MKKIISHILVVLSFASFIAGCERDEPLLSESIALNALELQLTSTRASNLVDPTLITPNNRFNWVLEVQIEGSDVAEYVFSESNLLWVPKSKPAYFPAGANSDGCNVTFTLHPPHNNSYVIIGQNGSASGLMEADILKNTLQLKPADIVRNISLAHANSMIEIVFDSSIENRSVELIVKGDSIHSYSIDNRKYLCIVPNKINNIVIISKVDGAEEKKSLSIDSGTKPNSRYVFNMIPYSDYSPVVIPWVEDNEAFDGVTSKEFIHIEGYDGVIVIRFAVSNTSIRVAPDLNSKKGEGFYCLPLISQNEVIYSLLLEDYFDSIPIGRNTSDINLIELKVDSYGKLLPRKESDGTILINTVGELLLVNTYLAANYKQEANIDLACIPGGNWKPIGSFETPFKGAYNGNGYAIHSLNMDIKQFTTWNPDHLGAYPDISNRMPRYQTMYWALPAGAAGLFGVNQGIINNVHIASGTISVSEITREHTKSIALGAICGYNDGGYLTHCTNHAQLKIHTISGDSDQLNIVTVGGICGTSRGSIEYSINYGDIIAEKGIFVGLAVGGICGNLYSRYQTDKIKINSCINHGNIVVGDLSLVSDGRFSYFGGISGMTNFYNSNGGSFKETIQHVSNCYNTGDLIDSGTKTIYGDFSGIVGNLCFPYSMYSCKISSCYNNGEIEVKPDMIQIILDPILCVTVQLFETSLPLESPVENCFYSAATTWKDVRSYKKDYYFGNIYGNGSDMTQEERHELADYGRLMDKEIQKSSPAFSADSWPNSEVWDDTVWADFGSWNNGHPVYPKLWIETNQ